MSWQVCTAVKADGNQCTCPAVWKYNLFKEGCPNLKAFLCGIHANAMESRGWVLENIGEELA